MQAHKALVDPAQLIPCISVAVQLKTLIALGMATIKVKSEKINSADIAHSNCKHMMRPY